MATKLTLEQFEEITDNMIVDDTGKINKKCPLCGNDVFYERNGSASTLKCKTENCFISTGRGI